MIAEVKPTMRQANIAYTKIWNLIGAGKPEEAVKVSKRMTAILEVRAKEKADRKRELVQK